MIFKIAYVLLAFYLVRVRANCDYEIVESMPDLMEYDSAISFHPKPTHQALIEMVENTQRTLRIASFYWFLSAEPKFASHPSALPGKNLMDSITRAVSRGVELQVVLDKSSTKGMSSQSDLDSLKELGTLKFVNMKKLLKAGVLHTKFLISDNKTFYVGSSNFDWRSYTQIKEIGISFRNCSQLAEDLDKIFQTYILMSNSSQVPRTLPTNLKTSINLDNPFRLNLDNEPMKLFLAGSPPAFNGVDDWTGRTDDIDGLLHIIDQANKHVDISVMNYSPRTEFIWPKKFWPRIDNALRKAAAERHVQVRLLFANWTHNKPEELMWYRSLNAVQSESLSGGGIHVRLFKVPSYNEFQNSIPFARVKHDKYLVTDNGLYIGTSNWAPDYFINTCGVSVVIEPENKSYSDNSIVRYMQELFERDFNSTYSQELD